MNKFICYGDFFCRADAVTGITLVRGDNEEASAALEISLTGNAVHKLQFDRWITAQSALHDIADQLNGRERHANFERIHVDFNMRNLSPDGNNKLPIEIVVKQDECAWAIACMATWCAILVALSIFLP